MSSAHALDQRVIRPALFYLGADALRRLAERCPRLERDRHSDLDRGLRLTCDQFNQSLNSDFTHCLDINLYRC